MRHLGRVGALILLIALPSRAAPLGGARFAELGFPSAPGKGELQGLLQRFVDQVYLKGFRRLGEERDFDHGHLLFDSHSRPVAILYHTQELSAGRALDPGARNWLQWLADGRVENASRYLRSSYPSTAAWELFQAVELPGLRARRTILDKMLDPRLIDVDAARSRQWVFTRIGCARAALAPASKDIRVVLPTKEEVCLALSAS